MAFAWSKSTPANGSVAIYELKTLLKLQGWTVPSSSDGTTYNAAGDQISSGGSGAGGMANNSAWFRIQDPAGVREFTFQRGTTNQQWRVKYSRASKFTGGSPGATQTPQAADQDTYIGGGSDAAPTYATAMLFADGGTSRWNCGADNAAPYGWWAGSFPNGGGTPQTGFVYDPLDATESTDSHKYIFHFGTTGGGGGPFAASIYLETVGLTAGGNHGYVASAGSGALVAVPGLSYTNGAATIYYPAGGSTNPISLKDEVLPIVFSRRAAIANPGYKGVSTLMKWIGTSRATGDTLSVLASRDRIVYANVSLPWDGTVPTV